MLYKLEDITASQYEENLIKKLSVIRKLQQNFTDLEVREFSTQIVFFYSKSINDKVQEITFTSDTISYGEKYKHYANLKLLYDTGDEVVEILPEVGKVPLFEYTAINTSTGTPAMIHYYNFEEAFMRMNTPKLLVGKCRLYIINELEKLRTQNVKANNFWMPESIKKLMPFT